MHIRLTNS